MTHFIFDCDDVLLDWQSGFTNYLLTRGVLVDAHGPRDWDMSIWIGCSDAEARQLVKDFNSSTHFPHLRPMPGMKQALWGLHDAGHTISVLTCCGDEPDVRLNRGLNLYQRFSRDRSDLPWIGQDSVITLPLGASKRESLRRLCATHGASNLVLIEDNYYHARDAADLGIEAICLRRNHNRKEEYMGENRGVIWAYDLLPLMNHYAPGCAA